MKRAVVYFFAGAAMDALIALYYIQIGARQVFSASILAALITVFSMLVINGILERGKDRRAKMTLLISYALGNGVGTALAMVVR